MTWVDELNARHQEVTGSICSFCNAEMGDEMWFHSRKMLSETEYEPAQCEVN